MTFIIENLGLFYCAFLVVFVVFMCVEPEGWKEIYHKLTDGEN